LLQLAHASALTVIGDNANDLAFTKTAESQNPSLLSLIRISTSCLGLFGVQGAVKFKSTL
jgi:hypothetical protein